MTLLDQYGIGDLPPEQLLAWAGRKIGLKSNQISAVMKTTRTKVEEWAEMVSEKIKIEN